MRFWKTKAALAAASIAGVMALSPSAQAGDNSFGIYVSDHGVKIHASSGRHGYHGDGHGKYKKNKHGHHDHYYHGDGHGKYKKKHGHYHDDHYRGGHKYKKHKGWRRSRHGYRGGHGYYRGHGCHPVYKYKWRHGHKVKIGGTQCYNRYGHPYIVPGSRYVIKRYGHGHGYRHGHGGRYHH